MRVRLILGFLALSIALVAALAVSGCSDGPTVTAPPGDRTTLNDGENSAGGGTSEPPDHTDGGDAGDAAKEAGDGALIDADADAAHD